VKPKNSPVNYRRIVSAVITSGALYGTAVPILAHEEGAPFSGAIIDPLVLHHAHIENEQRFNFFNSVGVEDGRRRNRTAYEGEFEFAYASPNFRYGAELFIPVASIPSPNDGGRESGIGDIEFRPLKLALYNSPEFILSTATAFRAPTGSESRGLGDGEWAGTQLLFSDFARGNWYLGVNFGVETSLTGPRESSFEYGAALAYSFIRDTQRGGLAAPSPNQNWVFATSLEVLGNRAFQGESSGDNSVSLIPGLSFWHVPSGWQMRIGVATPVSGARDADTTFLIQFGNHLNWKRLFGLGKTN
jgi:hypothetical protein